MSRFFELILYLFIVDYISWLVFEKNNCILLLYNFFTIYLHFFTVFIKSFEIIYIAHVSKNLLSHFLTECEIRTNAWSAFQLKIKMIDFILVSERSIFASRFIFTTEHTMCCWYFEYNPNAARLSSNIIIIIIINIRRFCFHTYYRKPNADNIW